jgi:RNA polymerase sigma-70 factor, ECF subfamily
MPHMLRPVTPERQLDPRTLGDHTDRLFRAAWALCGSPHDAEDLVQETYARVLSKPRFLRSEDDLGYLLRVLRNTFLTQQEAAGRRPPTAAGLEDEAELVRERESSQPEVAVETKQVFEALSTLSQDARDVIVAVDVAGLSYREAAKALRVPQGTVMSRLHRARSEVAKVLRG